MRPGIEETAMADEDDELEEEEGDAEGAPESDDDEEGEEGEGGASKKFNKIKLFIILGGVIFFLFLIGLSLFFFGILDPYLGLDEEDIVQEEAVVQGQVFYKLQDMTINLNEEGKKSRFMKVGLTLVLIDELDVPLVEALQPRIEDYITTYLRELKPEELSGSANFYRMRENLLLRVRAAVAPVQVTNVLFNSMLVQ
ncbi:MAG TPA: flagellar basal body protein FliL [Rhodospirillales bacterium]|jgi:flagellar FliL protein|nr:flagellar basal body protein FliL [Rhodospirillales bacterium]